MKAQWTTDWPSEPGRYWLYGRVWGDDEPQLYHIDVWKLGNGFAFVCNGHFLSRGDCEDEPQFQPIVLPELPEQKL